MDSIHSWIDAEEVRRLAESLSATPEKRQLLEKIEQESSAEIMNNDEQIEETARELPAEVVQRQRNVLADASAMANTAGLINSMRSASATPAPAAPAPAPVAPAVETPVQKRAEVEPETQIEETVPVQAIQEVSVSTEQPAESATGTFIDVEKLFNESAQAQGICAVDRDGDILYDSLDNPALSGFIVAILENASVFDVAEGEVRNTRLKTYADQVVEFIAVRSTRGVVVVAALLEKGMTKVHVNEIAVKLVQTLNS